MILRCGLKFFLQQRSTQSSAVTLLFYPETRKGECGGDFPPRAIGRSIHTRSKIKECGCVCEMRQCTAQKGGGGFFT